MLIAAHHLEIPVVEEPIKTIYEPGNKSSHFNPIIDSMKIYFVLLRFGSVSMMTALLDNLIFYLAYRRTGHVLGAQILARVFAVTFNYTMVRSSVFYSRQRHKAVLPKYLGLVVVSGTASYGGIRWLTASFGSARWRPNYSSRRSCSSSTSRCSAYSFSSRRRTAPRGERERRYRGFALAAAVVLAATGRHRDLRLHHRAPVRAGDLGAGGHQAVHALSGRVYLPGRAAAADVPVELRSGHGAAAAGADRGVGRGAAGGSRRVLPDLGLRAGNAADGSDPHGFAVRHPSGLGRVRFSHDARGAAAGELRGGLGRHTGDSHRARCARRVDPAAGMGRNADARGNCDRAESASHSDCWYSCSSRSGSWRSSRRSEPTDWRCTWRSP